MAFPLRQGGKFLKKVFLILPFLGIFLLLLRMMSDESTWPIELIGRTKQSEKRVTGDKSKGNGQVFKDIISPNIPGESNNLPLLKERFQKSGQSDQISERLVASTATEDILNEKRKQILPKDLGISLLIDNRAKSIYAGRLEEKQSITAVQPCMNVHAFYYPWYGNSKIDGHFSHWNHKILPHWDKEIDKLYRKAQHQPPNDIASDFYPELGAYSSNDPDVIQEHLMQIKSAKIGTIVVSYYPPGTADGNGKPWDDCYSLILDKAAENGLKVTFQIEPYNGRSELTVKNDVIRIVDLYGNHQGFYRYKINSYHQVPLFYVYDSYLTKQEDWAKVLKPAGPETIRGTKYDSVMIALLVDMPQSSYTSIGGFDGLYTYFAANGFTYGSRWENWKEISSRAKEMNFMFIPSVGPGYIDTNIRPWNYENNRGRSSGEYYKDSWMHALDVSPPVISITSFNEWHEGTQIEKAQPKRTNAKRYLDYQPFDPDYYLKLTSTFVNQFEELVLRKRGI